MKRFVFFICVVSLALAAYAATSSPDMHKRFHKLQRAPFLRGDRQFFLLDSVIYFRNYGEKKFRPAPQFNSQEALDAFRRTCAVSPFQDSPFLEKDYLDPPPMNDDKAPYEMFNDGFESGMANWTLANDGYPDIDWDPVTCRKHNYTCSAYALGGGPDTPGDCSHEFLGAEISMRTSVIVADCPSVYVEYYRWADLEFRHSYLAMEATSGSAYFMVDFFTGNSLGWQVRRIYLEGFGTGGYDTLNFGYLYYGGADYPANHEGCYVDDVLVTRDVWADDLFCFHVFPYMPDTGNPGQAGTFRSNLYIHNPHTQAVNVNCCTRDCYANINYNYAFTVAAERASSLANVLRCIVNDTHSPPSTPLGWGSYVVVYSDMPLGIVAGYVDNQTDDPAVAGPMGPGMNNAFAPLAIKSGPWSTELVLTNLSYDDAHIYIYLRNPFTGALIGSADTTINALEFFRSTDIVAVCGGSSGDFGVLELYSSSTGTAGYPVRFWGMTRQYTTSHTGGIYPLFNMQVLAQ